MKKNQKLKKDTSFEEYKVQNILSVNQLNGQIKLNEVWKSLNSTNYLIQWEKEQLLTNRSRVTR